MVPETRPAEATFAGLNGRLVLAVGGDIYTMYPDGTHVQNLTQSPESDSAPSWSPDGSAIAFASTVDNGREIFVMDADGSDRRRLTVNAYSDSDPSWSPDGAQIVFNTDRDGTDDIWVMDADGTDQRRVFAASGSAESWPEWSPDGTEIAFNWSSWTYVMRPDGTGNRPLESGTWTPGWSPDGMRIVAAQERYLDGCNGTRIVTMRASDGGDQRLIDRTCGTRAPVFSPDGAEIAFASASTIHFVPTSGAGSVRSFGLPSSITAIDWHPLARPPGVRIHSGLGRPTVTEGGAAATYTVSLDTRPVAPVTVAVVPDSQLDFAPREVVIRPDDWATARAIAVTAVDDGFDEPSPMTVDVVHRATSADADYHGLEVRLAVQVVDDDDPWQYFALGDGTASGHGLDDADLDCGRSPVGPAWRVAAELAMERTIEGHNLACVGAAAASTAAPGTARRLDAQVSGLLGLRNNGPAVASINIGASDLGLDDPVRARSWLCDQPEAAASDHVASTATRVQNAVATQVGRLLADPTVVVVLTEVYQPLNASPTWLNDPAIVGGIRQPCDLETAEERADDGVRAVNAALAAVRESIAADKRHRVRVALVDAIFRGHEGGSPGCGSSAPAEPESFIQHPGRGYSSDRGGDCFHPNERGARALAEAVVAAGDPPVADSTAPTTTMFTTDGTILVSVPGITEHPVLGKSEDGGAGVSTVLVTFTPETGAVPTTVGIRCPKADAASCRWSATPPSVPGGYTVTARATDRAGNLAGAGPLVRVIVL